MMRRRPVQQPLGFDAVGVEHEYAVSSGGNQVDFRAVLPRLGIPGRRLDPGDQFAVRTPSGLVVSCDGAEAEIATPPEPLASGFVGRVTRWTRGGAAILTTQLTEAEGWRLEGVSTHFSVSVPDAYTHAVGQLFLERFSASIMLLTDGEDSDGVLVRPRAGRVEVGTDYCSGDHLQAAIALAAGGIRACLEVVRGERHETSLPPRLEPRVERAVDRFGWYVDRTGFGGDLYDTGRLTPLPSDEHSLTAGHHLEHAWKVALEQLEEWAGPDDAVAGDRLVFGIGRLPVEAGMTRTPCPERCTARAAEGHVLDDILRPAFAVEPAAVTWHHAIFRITGRRTAYLSVSRRDLPTLLSSLRSGREDDRIRRFIARRVRHRPRVLTTYHQAVGEPALWDDVGAWESLAPPEPGVDGTARLLPSTRSSIPDLRATDDSGLEVDGRGDANGASSARLADAVPAMAPDGRAGKGPLPPRTAESEPTSWPRWLAAAVAVVAAVALVTWFATRSDDGTTATGTETATPQSPTRGSIGIGGESRPARDPVGLLYSLVRWMDNDAVLLELAAVRDDPGDGIFSIPTSRAGDFGDDVDQLATYALTVPITDAMHLGVPTDCASNPTGQPLIVVGPRDVGTDICEMDRWWSDDVLVAATPTEGGVEDRDEPGEMVQIEPPRVAIPGLRSGPSTPEGSVAVVGMTLAAAPASDPTLEYTYAVVADADGEPSNNWVPQEPYAWDLYQGTESWWVLDHRDGRWSLTRFAGSPDARRATSARVVVAGRSIMWFIPGGELPPGGRVRTTSFRHDGSFDPEASGGDVPGRDPTLSLVPLVETPLFGAWPGMSTSPAADTDVDGDPAVPASGESAVRAFIAAWSDAHASGDLTFLLQTLDPAVVDRYGEAQCRRHIEQTIGSARDIEIFAVTGPSELFYETDGHRQPIAGAFRADIRFTPPGLDPVEASPTFRVSQDGTVLWFADCGDPT